MSVAISAATVLLDIEGTTSSISFVYDVMFPYVRRELESFLAGSWGDSSLESACNQIAVDAGHTDLKTWRARVATTSPQDLVRDEVLRLMDGDVKATGLKQIQGLIWRAGFESGELRAHVYADVPGALRRWRTSGLELRVYSSGSIAAQRLFFRHTIEGDMLSQFQAHYDTTIGSKRAQASYEAIVDDTGRPASEILFVSDVIEELNAARAAGLQTILSQRPGNPGFASNDGHPPIRSFDEIDVVLCPAWRRGN